MTTMLLALVPLAMATGFLVWVMAMGARLFAEGVFDGVIGGGYGVNHPLFFKSLEGAINCYPIHFITIFFFDISMCQGAFIFIKHLKNLQAAICYTQAVFFQ